MDVDQLRRMRAVAQLLHRPATGSATELVRRLLAVQSQDNRAAPLALRARTADLTLAAVDEARDRREIVVGWLMRGTLHLVAAEDFGWLHALAVRGQHAPGDRRLGQLGVADVADRAVELIDRVLADGEPHSRTELIGRLAGAGIRTEGQAGIHLLALAARRRVCALGPVRDGELAYVSWRAWLGEPVEIDHDSAVAELALRYLAAHGPATDADLAAWSGLPLRDVRGGLRAIGDRLAELDGGLLALRRRPGPDPTAVPPRLLPAFDPYLLGWKDRTFAVEPGRSRAVAPGGGMLRATVAVDGRLVATWRLSRAGGLARVTVEPFDPLGDEVDVALRVETADLARFEGLRQNPPADRRSP